MYLILHSGEDGIDIQQLEYDEVMRRITPNKYGELWYGGESVVFLDAIPGSGDGYFIGVPNHALLILKAEIIVPKIKTVVTEYEL